MDYAAQTAVFLLAQFPKLLAGFLITVGISTAAIPLALALGLALLAPRMAKSRPVRSATVGYVDLMRNTPLLVQIYLIYFGLPVLRSEEHTSELQSQFHLVCRRLLENKNEL